MTILNSIVLAAALAIVQFSSLALSDPSFGCSSLIPKPVEWNPVPNEAKLFRINDRPVRITVPKNYNDTEPQPMIVAFHDADQPVEQLEFEGGFNDDNVNPDIIMVYPYANPENGDRWTSDIRPRPKRTTANPHKRANTTADIEFTYALVKDLENLMCIDTSRIYAVGVGVGAGMAHILACDQYISRMFAAYGAVAGIYGRGKPGKRPWGICNPARAVTPIVSVHGEDDRVAPYLLDEGENGKKRVIPPHWVDEWAERDGCGGWLEDEGWASEQSNIDRAKTWVGKYDEGGSMSETLSYGGAVTRIARKCPGFRKTQEKGDQSNAPTKLESNDQTTEDESPVLELLPSGPIPDGDASILHYKVKSYGHGWPRQHLIRQKEIMFHDTQVKFPHGKESSKDTFFDTTKVILDFFRSHVLDPEFSKRAPITPGEGGVPLSEEEMAKQVKAKYGLDHAELGKDSKSRKIDENISEAKMKEFEAAQMDIRKENEENKRTHKVGVKDEGKDEL